MAEEQPLSVTQIFPCVFRSDHIPAILDAANEMGVVVKILAEEGLEYEMGGRKHGVQIGETALGIHYTDFKELIPLFRRADQIRIKKTPHLIATE